MSNQYEFKMGMYLGELQQPFEQSLATARDLGAHYVWCGTHSNNRSLYELVRRRDRPSRRTGRRTRS